MKKNICSKQFNCCIPLNERGFTLLELLLSVFITAIILSIVLGAVRLGLRSWDKGEESAKLEQRIRIIKGHMQRQLSAICTEKILNSDQTKDAVAFVMQGSESSMSFCSYYAVLPFSKTTPVFVKYFVKEGETDDLYILETPVQTLKHEEILKISEHDSDDTYLLFEDISDISFEYLKQGENTGNVYWEPSLQDTVNNPIGFPASVRMSFSVRDRRVEFTVNIMSEYESVKGSLK